LSLNINFKCASVFTFKSKCIFNLSFTSFFQFYLLLIFIINESITLKLAKCWLNFNLAWISLPSKIKLYHRNTQKLCVTANICWHRNLRIFNSVCLSKTFQSLWRISNSCNRNIFNYQICIFKVRLSMLRTEEKLKINILTAWNFTLGWLNSVMNIFIFKSNFLLVFLFINTPMKWDENWRWISYSYYSFTFTSGICVFKIDCFKRIFFEIDFLAIDCYNI